MRGNTSTGLIKIITDLINKMSHQIRISDNLTHTNAVRFLVDFKICIQLEQVQELAIFSIQQMSAGRVHGLTGIPGVIAATHCHCGHNSAKGGVGIFTADS